MYKSFKFVLFNESFPNLAKFEIRPNFGQSWISAGCVTKAGFRPEPNSGTALVTYLYFLLVFGFAVFHYKCVNNPENWRFCHP